LLGKHLLDLEGGLPQSNHAFLYQDSFGFVWISSLDGLGRFDGREVRVFREGKTPEASTLWGNNIQSPFLEDSLGNVWFSTEKSIECYRRRQGVFSHHPLPAPPGAAQQDFYPYVFCLEKQRYLWLRAYDHLFVLDIRDTASWKRAQPLSPLDAVRCAADTSAGGWVSRVFACHWLDRSGFEVLHYDRARKLTRREPYFNGKNDPKFQGGLYLSGGHLLAFASQGTYFSARREPFQSSERRFSALLPLQGQGLQVFVKGDALGFYEPYTNRWEPLPGTEAKGGEGMFLSRSNTLWYSHASHGVRWGKLSRQMFSHIALPDPQSLIPGPGGKVLAYANRRLYEAAPGALLPQHLAIDSLDRLCVAPSGEVWAAKDSALFSLSAPEKKYILKKGSDFLCLAASEFGLLASSTKSLIALNQSTGEGQLVDSSYAALALAADASGGFWLGNDKSLRYYAREGGRLRRAREYPSPFVNHLCLDDEGQVWAATAKGLLRVSDSGIESLPAFEDLFLYAMVPDARGRLWASSTQGVYVWDPRTGERRHFTPLHGLSSYEYLAGEGARDEGGRIWFGSAKGLDYFHPDSVHYLGNAPRLALTGLEVMGRDWSPPGSDIQFASSIQLAPGQNLLTFHLAALEFLDPKNNRFKARLLRHSPSGADTSWVMLGKQSSITFSDLAPGSYRFEFTAANAEGIWQAEAQGVDLYLAPYFYQTSWFLALVIGFSMLVLGGLVALYYRDQLSRQQNQIMRKEREVEQLRFEQEKADSLSKLRERISKDLHDELGTGLTRIRLLAEGSVQKQHEEDSLRYIAEIARELDYNRKTLSWAQNPDADHLQALMSRVRIEASGFLRDLGLEAQLDFPEQYPALVIAGDRRLHVLRIVKELLNNIGRHAQARRVRVAVRLLPGTMQIDVEDDGVGFDPQNQPGVGQGLINLRERAQALGGSIRWERLPEGGMRAALWLPLSPAH
jgi:signal transduction histidine kinase